MTEDQKQAIINSWKEYFCSTIISDNFTTK